MDDYQFLGSNDRDVYRRVSLYRVLVQAKAQVRKMAGADQQRLRGLVEDVTQSNNVRLTPSESDILLTILQRHVRPIDKTAATCRWIIENLNMNRRLV